jgi:hypothetical protein
MTENRKRTAVGLGISPIHDDELPPKRLHLDSMTLEGHNDCFQSLCQEIRHIARFDEFPSTNEARFSSLILSLCLLKTYRMVESHLPPHHRSVLKEICQTGDSVTDYLKAIPNYERRELDEFYSNVIPEDSMFDLKKFLKLCEY